jgi:hypothetical protein
MGWRAHQYKNDSFELPRAPGEQKPEGNSDLIDASALLMSDELGVCVCVAHIFA